MERLEAHRRLFSRLVTANVGIANPEHPLVKAFASVPRERFVGTGPWQIFTAGGYIETSSDDPALIYQDITNWNQPER